MPKQLHIRLSDEVAKDLEAFRESQPAAPSYNSIIEAALKDWLAWLKKRKQKR